MVTALGRHPADYTSGVDAEITASMPASVAVARLLLRLLDTLEQNVDGVPPDQIDASGADALHVQRIIEAIIQSWETGSVVDL